MTTITKTVFLHLNHGIKAITDNPEDYAVLGFAATSSSFTPIFRMEVVFAIPDDFDPRPQQVAALKAQMGDHEQAITQIKRQINELQALEFVA